MSLFESDKSAERLPVSLITGFLGSGKTTLLNRVLRHDGMKDSAVIINEYGEVGLDHLLVERVDMRWPCLRAAASAALFAVISRRRFAHSW
jgi:molybdopterin-guanine dinucleotide biosynthesis protein